MSLNRFQDFVELAIENEVQAAHLYEKYSRVVTSATSQKLLADMATMERGHEKKLREFAATGIAWFSKIGVIADLHISDYLEPPVLGHDSSLQDVFVFAMKSEEKAHDLYARLARLELEPTVGRLFATLADEEKKHKHDLEIEYEKEFIKEN